MSRDPDDVNKLTESTYKNVMEQFNPGLRNLVNLGKNYEKSVAAMTLAGKAYFDAVSKIGENAAVSPVSRELGVVLMEISEVHKKVQLELEESFKRFHREIIIELERKTDMDVKYMTATFKRYQSEHKIRQDSLDKSHADLKKLRRKSQGKHSSKYEIKENEFLETITSRQTDMQKFIADGCREALLEEKRRFCFLVDKHCIFSYQMAAFHDKSNSDSVVPPPAPSLKAQTSPLANMFSQELPRSPISPEAYSDQDSLDGNGLSRSTSVSSGMNMLKKLRVQTIFPHTAGNNETLLSFDDGEIITLLIQEERDGWLYGEMEKTGQRGWFPSSYCRPYSEPVITNMIEAPLHPLNVVDLPEQHVEGEEEEEEEQQPVLLPPPDYSDSSRKPSTPSPQNTVSLPNGTSMPPFLGGGNPFATVKLRPTITNDRSAPII
ncbi:brain-specific angiogenesis inhibitor 1-associated protein 2-like protein 1a isoform X4 [Colossoma macropomum]|uniref:brain-specific angiogenesis inhibitor 1-associated protein 2-like protein 1a isoform X4 n=1 Tax=Colossoma macropomum TaxID=42526 RepID=UPI00186495AE|nr:brain-specific angiogenesis inhibitor 1-associated protein 2-like protein 1a isoform X4 [Colossoma macropomum]